MANLTQKIMKELLESKLKDCSEETFRLTLSEIQNACDGILEDSYKRVYTYMGDQTKGPFIQACKAKGVSRLGMYKRDRLLGTTDTIDLNNCDDVYILLGANDDDASQEEKAIKVACFIQTKDPKKHIDYRTPESIKTALDAVKQTDVDILLFPELTYYIMEDGTELKTLFAQTDCLNEESLNQLYESVLAISRKLGKAIVVTNVDSAKRIVSIYANSQARSGETRCKRYIKFTFSGNDAIKEDAATFDRIVEHNYEPILYKGKRIGLTICADCERRIFSAGYKDIDILLNGTGGFVVDLKWRTHTRSRAIENKVYTITAMGKEADIDKKTGDYKKGLTYDQTYAFDYNGEEMKPIIKRLAGCVDIYELSAVTTPDTPDVKLSIGAAVPQTPYELLTPFCKESYRMLYPNIYEGPRFIDAKGKDYSVYYAIIKNDDIFDNQKVLELFDEFKEIDMYNRCIIINQWDYNCPSVERQKLIALMGALALEMYACVVLETPNDNLCIQVADRSKTKLKKRSASDGRYIIDLSFVHNGFCEWYKTKRDNKKAWPNNSKLISRL